LRCVDHRHHLPEHRAFRIGQLVDQRKVIAVAVGQQVDVETARQAGVIIGLRLVFEPLGFAVADVEQDLRRMRFRRQQKQRAESLRLFGRQVQPVVDVDIAQRAQIVEAAQRQRAFDCIGRQAIALLPAVGDQHAAQVAAGRTAADENARRIDAERRPVMIKPGDGAAHLMHDLRQRRFRRQRIFQRGDRHTAAGERGGHRAGFLFAL